MLIQVFTEASKTEVTTGLPRALGRPVGHRVTESLSTGRGGWSGGAESAYLVLTEDSHTKGGEHRNLCLAEQRVIDPAVASGDLEGKRPTSVPSTPALREAGEEDPAHLALLQKEKQESKLGAGGHTGREVPKAVAHTFHRTGVRAQGLPRPAR